MVVRYNTSLDTQHTFSHDSNGREMITRVTNKRGPAYPDPYQISEPVAGNYYPVNSNMRLKVGESLLEPAPFVRDRSVITACSVIRARSLF